MTKEQRKIILDLATFYNKEERSKNFNIKFAKDVIEKFRFSYFSILRGKRFAKFWQSVIDNTAFLNNIYSKTDITRLFYFLNNISKQICCETCNKPYTKKINPTQKYPCVFHCNNRCAQKDKNVLNKVAQTKIQNNTTTKQLLERTKKLNKKQYGVDWYFQTEEFKQKKEEAWKKNGYNHPMHSEKIKEQMTKRYFEKYGVECSFKNKSVQQKMKKKYKYDNLYFDSSPEIAYYIWLKDNNIQFEYKPNIVFYYECKNATHFYMPDFKVENTFIELKGDQFFDANGKMINPFDEKQNELYEAKHQCMLNNNVTIIRSSAYQKYLTYVENKFGKNYLKQFKQNNV